MTLRASIDVALEPAAAFTTIVEELAATLASQGLHVDAGPNGAVTEGTTRVGRIVTWQPGRRVALEWHTLPDETALVDLRFEHVPDGTRVTLEYDRWGAMLGEGVERAGWFASAVAAPLMRATAPAAFGDWFTDRRARRPSGGDSRAFYRDPLYHYPGFRVILRELALTPDDSLLDVGCGGGAFLKDALRAGCQATGVDHSPDMLRVARDLNQDTVAQGRLDLVEAHAERLPFADHTFTCATMNGVLGFLTEPVTVLAQIRRVLRPGGRLVLLGSDPELKGTPACPEPIASRLRFYDDDGLRQLGQEAGFDRVDVRRENLEGYARDAGVPEPELAIFAGRDARFLIASRH